MFFSGWTCGGGSAATIIVSRDTSIWIIWDLPDASIRIPCPKKDIVLFHKLQAAGISVVTESFFGFNKLILHYPCAVTAASRALTIADLALRTTRQPELYILWSQYNHTLPCPTLIFTVWVPVCATAPPVRSPAKASAILNVSVTAVTASRFSPVHFKPHQQWNVFLIFTLTHIHAVNSVASSLLYIDAIVASMYQGSLPGGKWNIRCNGNDKIDDQTGGYRQHNISFCCNKTLVPRNQLSPYRKRLMFESHGTGTSIFWITLRFDGHIWASPTKSNRSLMQRLQHPHLPRARHRHGIHVIYLY